MFADGERIEYDSADDNMALLFTFLDSPKDGHCEFSQDGEQVMTIEKKGSQVTLTFRGQTETTTVSEMREKFLAAKYRGQVDACKLNLKYLGTALEMYSVDYETYPDDLSKLTPEYLKELPKCPTSEHSSYSYEKQPEPVHYLLHCSGGDHSAAGLKAGLPAYSGEEGVIEK